MPSSTSQSTVLAIAGAALALAGLNTHKLVYEIIPTWFILPLIAFAIMYLILKYAMPFVKSTAVNTAFHKLNQHKGLRALLILSSLYVAFSIGANNVANAAAPIASLTANEIGADDLANFLPIIILSVPIVAPCFAIGSSLMGHKVTESTGKGIVSVSPFQATLIAIIVATLLLLASMTKGIPTSLVQLNGAAFIALSISKNGWRETFSNKTVKRFFSVWAVAPLIAFLLSYLLIELMV